VIWLAVQIWGLLLAAFIFGLGTGLWVAARDRRKQAARNAEMSGSLSSEPDA
jgi:hypothetical protein